MREAVIVSTARTPIGKAHRGAFNDTQAQTLGGHAISPHRLNWPDCCLLACTSNTNPAPSTSFTASDTEPSLCVSGWISSMAPP